MSSPDPDSYTPLGPELIRLQDSPSTLSQIGLPHPSGMLPAAESAFEKLQYCDSTMPSAFTSLSVSRLRPSSPREIRAYKQRLLNSISVCARRWFAASRLDPTAPLMRITVNTISSPITTEQYSRRRTDARVIAKLDSKCARDPTPRRFETEGERKRRT